MARRGRRHRIVTCMTEDELAFVREAARASGARSLGAWASDVLAREARRQLRSGEVPLEFFASHGPRDPDASVRRALGEERGAGM